MSRNSKRIWGIVRLVIFAFLIVGTIDLISIGSTAFHSDAAQKGMKFVGLSDLMETKVVAPPQPSSPYGTLAYAPNLHANVIDSSSASSLSTMPNAL